jgi:formate/nitrite transporter FocA (FNT family)
MPLTQPAEKQEARDRASPGAHIVYEAIRSEGETELQRPNRQLFWSGLAAGLSMGFSLLTEALLQASLPESPSKHLLVKLGYSVGFLVVILGRQQLFTENSLTPVLPVLRDRPKGGVVQILRLWLVVLVANLLGAFLFAWCLVRLPVVDESTLKAAVEVSSYVGSGSFWDNFFRSTIAGWLIALLVWLMPFAETGRIWVIIALTTSSASASFPTSSRAASRPSC